MFRRDDQPHDGVSRMRRAWRAGVVALALTMGVNVAHGQEVEVEEARGAEPAGLVEAYMQRLGLKRLQAEDLAGRVQTATGKDRVILAERLAKLYVGLLSESQSPADRRAWEARSRDLLKLVPEADSSELRLNLTKTLHLQATEMAERHRIRLATPEEVGEAERVLRAIKPELDDIAQRVNRRVEQLELMEERGETSDKIADELADLRRVRSQAFYYLGWTNYYIALLTGADDAALDATKSFGWLLNSRGGRPPSLDRIPKGLFKYEHVARSAAGVGLATAMRGNHVAALAWLDAIEETAEISDAVRENLVTWRIAILSSSKRWADLERFVRLTRSSDRTGGGPNVKPLAVIPARLLAVSALEADGSLSGEVVGPLAAIAMGDLVSGGEISHVLDLTQRYGTAPIGEKGFVVNYVRGIQQYEKARTAHKGAATGSVSGEGEESASDVPTSDPASIEAYRLAASLLKGAVEETDAGGFLVERGKASMLWGFSLFYSGQLVEAAARFSETAKIAATAEQSEEAMWLAVLSLDHAVEKGSAGLTKQRDELATLFLQTHPDSVHAAKLLLRRAMTGALESDEAIRILMGVEKDSSMYTPARQHAARLMYQQFRGARGSERDFAAMRFVAVAEETLNMDRRTAMEAEGSTAVDAAQRVVARVRQILDALLGSQNVDAARAEAALETLSTVATSHKLDISGLASEITFRRVQIAIAKNDAETTSTLIDSLQSEGGQFATAADQLMYKQAVTRRQRGEMKSEVLADIVKYGSRLAERMGSDAGSMKDAAVLSLHQVVAEAATELWRTRQDSAMLHAAVAVDTRLLAVQPRNQGALRRLASNSESTGNAARALECWRTLLAGLQSGSMEWFEARYESVRLLAATDAPRAKEALKQHVVLYPMYGPEPWGAKLKKLEDELKDVAAPASAPGGGGSVGGGP